MYVAGKTVAIIPTGLRHDIHGNEVFQEPKVARPSLTHTATLAAGTGDQIVAKVETVPSEP